MVRQTNPRKKQQNQRNEGDEIPLKAKRRASKEKYRHQKNSWIEDDEDYDLENDLFEVDEDFIFEDELDSDFISEYNKDFEEKDTDDDDQLDDEDNY